MIAYIKNDFSHEISIQDKIRVVKGELFSAEGLVVSIEDNMVTFKPTNLEGFDENLTINKQFLEKYFEMGDMVRIISGQYKGETGIITEIGKLSPEKSETSSKPVNRHPVVKLDKSQRELRINKLFLKLKGDHDCDYAKLREIGI